MRRSCAPSNKSIKIGGKSNNQKPIQTFTQSISKENLSSSLTEQNIIYNVVWSKRTAKKHKIWEGDGTLEVKEKLIILKNLNGQILGTSNDFKTEEITQGNIIIVGTKEIEIQEKLGNETLPPISKKIKLKDAGIEKRDSVEKKKKNLGVFVPNLQLTNTFKSNTLSKLTKSNLQQTTSLLKNELNLPKPSIEHQWEHNTKKKTLTEVKVSPSLVKHLRNHQRDGVTFLYECLLGFRNPNYFGAILADEMGLGKTLQCLAVCHTLLKQGPYGSDRYIHRVLIVTPSSLTDNWSNEINKWLANEKMFAYVVNAKHKPNHYSKQMHLPFVIVSYETLLSKCDDFEKMNFDVLICDEGHRLKNNNIKISVCLKQLKIKRTIILTGTPLQNDLEEFYHLVDFVNPGILGSYMEYKYQYENPIIRSQLLDADEETRELGTKRAAELNKITSTFILRRTQSINNEYLPKKREYIVFVRPSELQLNMLKKVLEWYEENQCFMEIDFNHLQIINLLKKICNHPALVKTIKNKNKLIMYLEKYLPNSSEVLESFHSGKLELLQNFLTEVVQKKKEKIVIVSYYTKTLDLIQGLCSRMDCKYLRLDGQTTTISRNSIVKKFNHENNTDIFVFLLSAKAGGLGLNLTGASRLILFDNDWNPATDLQAMSRIWRDGQKFNAKIYRLITAGTIEEKIFQRQIAKSSLSDCVMNPLNNLNNTTIKFSNEELKDLFTVYVDYDKNVTHESLHCKCEGNGKKNEDISSDNNENDDPFRIDINGLFPKAQKNEFLVNELMQWEHHKSPISHDFLKESSLFGDAKNISFIFSNEIKSSA